MKILFLIFHGFGEANGISKKIRYQVKALRNCGHDTRLCYYDVASDGHRRWMVDDREIADLGTGKVAKMKKRCDFSPIIDYVDREKIRLVYIRSYHNANPFTIHMVKSLRQRGAKVVMEIPTYPYDQEYITPSMKLILLMDKCFRRKLAKELDAIVTFSEEREIFGAPTIRISNGIDFDAIRLRKSTNDTARELHLIGVAEIHYWHGFDRIIKGMAEYYRTDPEYKVYFHIVGDFSGERERQEILTPIRENRLEPYVLLHGAQHGQALEALFDRGDFAIGSLGRHRSGITYIKTLKNREYAARGFAFVYSETDEDFENQPYILKAPADESPVDIHRLIDFYRKQTMTPAEIRESIAGLSWNVQMQSVINQLFGAE